MKKITAGMAVLAAAGFTGLTMVPAAAAPIVFDNCTQAAQYGVYNIPAGSPGYGTHLDQPVDGVGCEKDGAVYNAALVPDDGVSVPPVTPVAETPTDVAGFDNCTEARASRAATTRPRPAPTSSSTTCPSPGATVSTTRSVRSPWVGLRPVSPWSPRTPCPAWPWPVV